MKKIYEKPSTSFTAVETESGFMGASIYEEKENTEDLSIDDQQVYTNEDGSNPFDFSNTDQWSN